MGNLCQSDFEGPPYGSDEEGTLEKRMVVCSLLSAKGVANQCASNVWRQALAARQVILPAMA
jgi:hypothetical protein